MTDTLEKVFNEALLSAIPETALTVSEWAEKYRYVSAESVADPALEGLWKNERTPYLTGIMDAFSQPDVNEILLLKSAQVGGTEVLLNIIGKLVHTDPCPILYACETEDKAKAWSKEKLSPMIRDTPALTSVVAAARQKDMNNTIEAKKFRGGHLAIAYATSPATLSSRPRRVVLLDEVEAFDSTHEGDPVKLAEARTKTAGRERKIVYVSTPRTKEGSRMLPLWDSSTQERYFVPCPQCGEYQILEWANLRWDDEPLLAYYACPINGCVIEHDEKLEMLAFGEWRSMNPAYKGNRRAFWINELYSPFTTWGEMAADFVTAKARPDTLQVFVNTRLAEYWDAQGQQIEYANLSFKREEYAAEVPDGVMVVTAGVDVQGDRLECEVVGWGIDDESWSLDYRTFYGDPSQPEVWSDLREHLLRDWQGVNESEVFRVKSACIDSGGHHTNEVYNFAKANAARRWFAVKGANVAGKPLVSKYNVVGQQRVKLFTIGTETAKDKIFASLRVEKDDENLDAVPNYAHFPHDRDDYYFKMLCAEKQITKFTMGRAKKVWVKVSEHARNEALDCRVYALAALEILKSNFKDLLKAKRSTVKVKAESEEMNANEQQTEPQRPQRRNSFVGQTRGFIGRGKGFVGGWR